MQKNFYKLIRKEPNYFSHIEGLRAFAAWRVMLHHIAVFGSLFFQQSQYWEMLKHPLFKATLSTAVLLDIFFAISGLVIGHSLIKSYKEQGKINVYDFFVRRFARIFPMYLFIAIVAIPLYYSNFHNIWANILQINNMLSFEEQYIAWTWSLAVDFQFYTLFVLILWLISKKVLGKKSCCALVLGFFLVPFVVVPLIIASHHYYHFTPNAFVLKNPECWQYINIGYDKLYVRTSSLLLGVLSAYVLVYHHEEFHARLQRISKMGINAIALSLIALIALLLANDPIWTLTQVPITWQNNTFWAISIQRVLFSMALCSLLLLASAPKGFVMNSIIKALNSALLRPFGRLSYTTYMIHPLVMLPGYLIFFASHKSITAEAFFKQGFILILLTYIIAVPVYLFYEHPAKLKIKATFLRSNRLKVITLLKASQETSSKPTS